MIDPTLVDRRVRRFAVNLDDQEYVVEATTIGAAVLEARRIFAIRTPDWRWHTPTHYGTREVGSDEETDL